MAKYYNSKHEDYYFEIGDYVSINSSKCNFSHGFIAYEYTQKGNTIYVIEPNPYDYMGNESIPDPVHLSKGEFNLDPSESIKS